MSKACQYEYPALWTNSCPATEENPFDMSGNSICKGFVAGLLTSGHVYTTECSSTHRYPVVECACVCIKLEVFLLPGRDTLCDT